jgi:TRAP-type mannitol/chloroaromatic compound transport system substrate-binding protein
MMTNVTCCHSAMVLYVGKNDEKCYSLSFCYGLASKKNNDERCSLSLCCDISGMNEQQ